MTVSQDRRTNLAESGFWAVYASVAILPILWALVVPWFIQLDPIAHARAQSMGIFGSLAVVLGTITITFYRLREGSGPHLPYRTARDLIGLLVTAAFIQWWSHSQDPSVPYLAAFTVLCLQIGSGLPVAIAVYIIGRRTLRDEAGLALPKTLPSIRTVFVLNAASISLVIALVLGIGLTARSAGKVEAEQGAELGRISSLVADAITNASDQKIRNRILNLWQRTGYGEPVILSGRNQPRAMKNAYRVANTPYGYYVLDRWGGRHHIAYRSVPNGTLWLTLAADQLPPVRAPDLGPALLLLALLLLGAPFATWLVATDLKGELRYITDALRNLSIIDEPVLSESTGFVRSIALPGVPIPGNDEAGDLAAELNQACRSFANANQRLIRELRLAAQSDEAQSLFLHGTSQALRQPLVDISSECTELSKTSLSDAQREDIAVIETATHQLTSHVDEILKLSQLSNWEALPLEPATFDAGLLAAEVLTALAERASPQVSAEIATADDVRLAYADRKRVRQVLENLIDNALKFTAEGFVRVTVINGAFEDGRPAVHVQVWDSGPGIPEHEQEAVFTEFYRVAGQRAVPGTGLGLAIASRLVERQGGRLWLESIVGDGSAFHLLIPVLEET
jgi:signal transduction histidine kinase